MGRKTRQRWVKRTPDNIYFKEGAPSLEDSVILTVAEFEAMRLRHYVNLNQKDSAKNMGVSQPTFSRILDNAHQRVTQALMEGKLIKVYGGNINYKKVFIGYGCLNCNNEWEDKKASKNKLIECPNCLSKSTYYLEKEPI